MLMCITQRQIKQKCNLSTSSSNTRYILVNYLYIR